MRFRIRPGLRHFLTLLYIPTCLITFAYVAGIRINLTSSMPLGLYYFSSSSTINWPKRGDIVAVCLPENIAKEGLKRHYLFYGHCHSNGAVHSMAVLKKVIAVPNDEVIVTDTQMIVNGRGYFAPQQATDSNNLPVTHFIHKRFYSHVTGFWLYGENSPVRSWDSRYYGGIARKHIIGAYKPLWVSRKSGGWFGDTIGATVSRGASPGQSAPNRNKNPANSHSRGGFVSYFS